MLRASCPALRHVLRGPRSRPHPAPPLSPNQHPGSRGFGFVIFSEPAAVNRAIAAGTTDAHGTFHKLGGKDVEIKRCISREGMRELAASAPAKRLLSGSAASAVKRFVEKLVGALRDSASSGEARRETASASAPPPPHSPATKARPDCTIREVEPSPTLRAPPHEAADPVEKRCIGEVRAGRQGRCNQ